MNIRLFLLGFLVPIFANGTGIQHFDQEDSRWNVANTIPAGTPQNPSFATTTTTLYGIVGNTFLNGDLWRRVYATDDSLFTTGLVFTGLIRTVNNRVLFIDSSGLLDTLYDFNLQPGDSVWYDFGSFAEKLPLQSIDSFQIDQQYYRRFHFGEPSGLSAFTQLNEVWIEGIGSIHGPLFPKHPRLFSTEVPDSLQLICSYSANQQVWQHPSYTSCYINIVLNVADPQTADWNVYPNPAKDLIMINFNTMNATSDRTRILRIKDARGAVVHQQEVVDVDQFVSVDMSEQSAGIYYLEVRTESGLQLTKRLAVMR